MCNYVAYNRFYKHRFLHLYYKNPTMISRVIAKNIGDVFLRHSVHSRLSNVAYSACGAFFGHVSLCTVSHASYMPSLLRRSIVIRAIGSQLQNMVIISLIVSGHIYVLLVVSGKM